MSFGAQDVKKLREMTGAPMMECKNALTEADGDMEAAKKVLRERGLSKMAKRSDRETSEGLVRIHIGEGNQGGTAVVVTCETDFTAKNDQFQGLADKTLDAAISIAGDSLTSDQVLAAEVDGKAMSGHLEDVANAIRENMGVSTVVRYGGVCGGYVHFNGKTGVIIEATCSDEDAGGSEAVKTVLKNVSMHVASADPAPLAVNGDEISQQVVDDEHAFLLKQAIDSGKPEEIAKKMVDGRMKKFYSERALVEQPFVMSPDQTVGELIAATGKELGCELKLTRFERMKIGD